ncbi:MAG: phosphotyrosine protein phosphatase [Cyanobacteria bacterium P01_F01_bin.153]
MSQRQKLASETINVLFVCSMNKWRSPTAEKLYRNKPLVNVRSAGTSSKAKRHISSKDLKWADLVITMESKHTQRLRADFPEFMRHKEVHTLEVEDRYEYMHPELVEELKAAIAPILENYA